MDTSKVWQVFRNVNLSISLFMVGSVLIQILLIAMSIGAVWVVEILLPLTVVLLLLNLGFGAYILFQILIKKKKQYYSTFGWIIGNQVLIFIGLIVLFASGMTLVNF